VPVDNLLPTDHRLMYFLGQFDAKFTTEWFPIMCGSPPHLDAKWGRRMQNWDQLWTQIGSNLGPNMGPIWTRNGVQFGITVWSKLDPEWPQIGAKIGSNLGPNWVQFGVK
jgi:hypothetical protein